ncbi:NAD(P)/FAD-dependent oxidoreductase [Desulfosudis oleivorans]|uniref:FAD dependent oxidoreductase n=1 Tax=Desulfosudis oleivorans (strain DSM 6200 / JCM 39069 / Hxd3) TaxID=96561 RepID=A8ZT45_DESOH|nr:NAD(P)/FAD-dependent oxidoreductase [Desulfosudis oleivorans]ABW66209.1 FAD dependent oxidoreductase [Desulfosudis oleivorans Hxd3]
MKIIIVGGGPAGLITALCLARMHGAEICLHEKQGPPAYTSSLCAEGISRDMLQRLERHTGFDSTPFISRAVCGIQVHFPGGKCGYLHQPGATLERTAWQQAMAEFAGRRGVEVFWESRVSGIDELDADVVVGADGPASRIRTAIGGTVDMVPAVQYRMNLDRPREFLEFFIDERFYHGKHNDGYAWIFPKKDSFNVGVKGSFEQLDLFLSAFDIRGEITHRGGAPIAVHGTRFEGTLDRRKVFLIGDAAGLTNAATCGGLNPIIACADFLRQAVGWQEEGAYTRLIKTHHYDPAYWKAVRHLFYPPDATLRALGEILNNGPVNPTPAMAARVTFHPGLWVYCGRLLRHLKPLKQVAW